MFDPQWSLRHPAGASRCAASGWSVMPKFLLAPIRPRRAKIALRGAKLLLLFLFKPSRITVMQADLPCAAGRTEPPETPAVARESAGSQTDREGTPPTR